MSLVNVWWPLVKDDISGQHGIAVDVSGGTRYPGNRLFYLQPIDPLPKKWAALINYEPESE